MTRQTAGKRPAGQDRPGGPISTGLSDGSSASETHRGQWEVPYYSIHMPKMTKFWPLQRTNDAFFGR